MVRLTSTLISDDRYSRKIDISLGTRVMQNKLSTGQSRKIKTDVPHGSKLFNEQQQLFPMCCILAARQFIGVRIIHDCS